MEVIIYCSAAAGAWPLSAERKIEVSAEQRLQMYVVNGSDGRCIVAVRLIVGVRYLERPLREVLLYMSPNDVFGPAWAPRNAQRANVGPAG